MDIACLNMIESLSLRIQSLDNRLDLFQHELNDVLLAIDEIRKILDSME